VLACTGEHSLDGLEEKFSARRQQLDELKTLTAKVAATTSIVGYSGVTTQFLLAGNKVVSLSEALEKFSSSRIQLERITKLVQVLGVKNFSVARNGSIYVMMSTGGALGSSSGYIYDESMNLLKETHQHKQVSGEQHWYVFLAS
jgi:hypothetical protein